MLVRGRAGADGLDAFQEGEGTAGVMRLAQQADLGACDGQRFAFSAADDERGFGCRTLDELYAFPRPLYSSFEAKGALVKASLHSELFPRISTVVGQQRSAAARKILDRAFPRTPERARKVAATNIRYYLGAYTWLYYRTVIRCSFEDTVACAETAIRQAVAALGD